MPTAQRERNRVCVEAIHHAMAFANLASAVCFDDSTPTFGIRHPGPGGERKGAVGFRSKRDAGLTQLRESIRSRRPSMVTRNGARHNKSGQYDCARDHNICGRRISVLDSQARGGLADARRRAWRGSAEQRPQVRIRTPSPDFVAHAARVFTSSFPSGHATLSAITYLTMGALLARLHTSLRIRIYLISVAVFLILLIGMSRVYLSVHYPTDVLGGWCIGAAWAMGCWVLMTWLQQGGRVEPPDPS